jgi:hypothetical protein
MVCPLKVWLVALAASASAVVVAPRQTSNPPNTKGEGSLIPKPKGWLAKYTPIMIHQSERTSVKPVVDAEKMSIEFSDSAHQFARRDKLTIVDYPKQWLFKLFPGLNHMENQDITQLAVENSHFEIREPPHPEVRRTSRYSQQIHLERRTFDNSEDWILKHLHLIPSEQKPKSTSHPPTIQEGPKLKPARHLAKRNECNLSPAIRSPNLPHFEDSKKGVSESLPVFEAAKVESAHQRVPRNIYNYVESDDHPNWEKFSDWVIHHIPFYTPPPRHTPEERAARKAFEATTPDEHIQSLLLAGCREYDSQNRKRSTEYDALESLGIQPSEDSKTHKAPRRTFENNQFDNRNPTKAVSMELIPTVSSQRSNWVATRSTGSAVSQPTILGTSTFSHYHSKDTHLSTPSNGLKLVKPVQFTSIKPDPTASRVDRSRSSPSSSSEASGFKRVRRIEAISSIPNPSKEYNGSKIFSSSGIGSSLTASSGLATATTSPAVLQSTSSNTLGIATSTTQGGSALFLATHTLVPSSRLPLGISPQGDAVETSRFNQFITHNKQDMSEPLECHLSPNLYYCIETDYTIHGQESLAKVAQDFGIDLPYLLAANSQVIDPDSTELPNQVNIPAQGYPSTREGLDKASKELKDIGCEICEIKGKETVETLQKGDVTEDPNTEITQSFVAALLPGTKLSCNAQISDIEIQSVLNANLNIKDLKPDQVIKIPVQLMDRGTVVWSNKCFTSDINVLRPTPPTSKFRREEAKSKDKIAEKTTIAVGPTSSPIVNLVIKITEGPDRVGEKADKKEWKQDSRNQIKEDKLNESIIAAKQDLQDKKQALENLKKGKETDNAKETGTDKAKERKDNGENTAKETGTDKAKERKDNGENTAKVTETEPGREVAKESGKDKIDGKITTKSAEKDTTNAPQPPAKEPSREAIDAATRTKNQAEEIVKHAKTKKEREKEAQVEYEGRWGKSREGHVSYYFSKGGKADEQPPMAAPPGSH